MGGKSSLSSQKDRILTVLETLVMARFKLSSWPIYFGSASLAVAVLSPIPFEVAHGQEDSPLCLEQVFSVSQEMQQQYGLNIRQPTASILDDRVNPFSGSYIRYFSIITNYSDERAWIKKATSNAENFMNSPGIQLRLAKRVMEACASTSQVSFGFARSGYWIPYFRMPSGRIREGIPLSCNRDRMNTNLQWGYFFSC